MKKAFTRWQTYVIGLALVIIASCVGVIPYFACNDASVWPYSFIYYVLLFAGVVIFGVGFIIQDVYRARTRHKTKNWNNPLPEENLNVAWAIFAPAIIGGGTSFIIGLILSFILPNIIH